MMEKVVGSRPAVMIEIGGVSVNCLLDTGSQVSTITETFFNESLLFNNCTPQSLPGWLTLKAANDLPIPFIGYIEMDVVVLGRKVSNRGFLILKDTPESLKSTTKTTMPGVLGMNVIKSCRDILFSEFGPTYKTAGSSIDSSFDLWLTAFRICEQEVRTGIHSVLKVFGELPIRVPAWSVLTLRVSGKLQVGQCALAEPLYSVDHLPSDLRVVDTLVSGDTNRLEIRVANTGSEDFWLPPNTPVGVLSRVVEITSPTTPVTVTEMSINEIHLV